MIFLVLPDVEILDLAGPLQVFTEANRSQKRYRVRTVASRPSLQSAQGLRFDGLEALPEVDERDLIIVPGVPYRATLRFERGVIRWLRSARSIGARVASVCTGAFALGEAGLLDGRRCTTHWSRVDDLRRRYPSADVIADRLFVVDGRIMTSAGIASGIDLALSIIEQDHGPLTTAEIAREMVVYMRRDGGHRQESVYLDYRTHMHPGIHRVQDELTRHPEKRRTLDELADVAGMSRRSLTRTFRQMTGLSVHQFTTRLRLEMAELLGSDPTLTREAIANRAGFHSGRQLRRLRHKR